MREKMDPAFEAETKKCNSLAMLRDAAKKISSFKTTALDSAVHVRICIIDYVVRLLGT